MNLFCSVFTYSYISLRFACARYYRSTMKINKIYFALYSLNRIFAKNPKYECDERVSVIYNMYGSMLAGMLGGDYHDYV